MLRFIPNLIDFGPLIGQICIYLNDTNLRQIAAPPAHAISSGSRIQWTLISQICIYLNDTYNLRQIAAPPAHAISSGSRIQRTSGATFRTQTCSFTGVMT